MLQLESRVCEGCDEVQFVDTTGTYDATTNQGGYGPENGPESPADFDSYTLEVWFPGSDIYGDPDYTLDLLADIPDPDTDGYYAWLISAENMGVSAITSGLWYFKATAEYGFATYISDKEVILVKDVKEDLDLKMLDYDPNSECKNCKNGEGDMTEIFAQYLTIACGGICDGVKAQAAVSNLYQRVSNCC